MKTYRQGDVLVKRVDSIPAGLKPVKPVLGLVILAHGEVTGHHHSLPAGNGRVVMYGQDDEGPRYIDVQRPTKLSHQEHSAIELPAGLYEVIRQREYTPLEIRRVAD